MKRPVDPKRPLAILTVVLALALLAALLWGRYRGVEPLPLRTEEAKAFAQEIKALGADRVSVRYGYPQWAEITIQGKDFSPEETAQIRARTLDLLADPAFQAGFARAYAARYASAPASIDPPEGAAPNAAVVASLILRTDGELTAEKHLSQFPFESWND